MLVYKKKPLPRTFNMFEVQGEKEGAMAQNVSLVLEYQKPIKMMIGLKCV